MSGGLVTAAYIVAAILFIFSLAGLSKHETSQQGNNFGIAGMAIALIATIFGPDTGNVAWILVAMIIGGAIGIRLAKRVEMTEMPELVAILHSFVGLAAVLVGFNSYLYHAGSGTDSGQYSPDRSVPRHLHRCGDLHRFHCGVRQAAREDLL
jgi:NAD(P) transhydrogenase subunit beta